MTKEEALLELAIVDAYVLNDFIKISIPAAIAILTTLVSAYLANRLNKLSREMAKKEMEFRQQLAALEAKHASSVSFYENRRVQLENVTLCFNNFAEPASVFYTQVIVKLKKDEAGEPVRKSLEGTLSKYESSMWKAYSDANKAKVILRLNGFNSSSTLLIKVLSHASKARALYHDYLQKKSTVNVTVLTNHFSEFRRLGGMFLASLSNDYKTLINHSNDGQ